MISGSCSWRRPFSAEHGFAVPQDWPFEDEDVRLGSEITEQFSFTVTHSGIVYCQKAKTVKQFPILEQGSSPKFSLSGPGRRRNRSRILQELVYPGAIGALSYSVLSSTTLRERSPWKNRS